MSVRRISAAPLCAVWLAMSGCRLAQPPASAPWTSVTLAPDDRILILAPHPDDEMLGCAGIIQEAVAMKLPLRVVFFTYGDNNQWSFVVYRHHPVLMPKAVRAMGLIRHNEAANAARVLNVPESQLTFLGYPDFGTLSIWSAHWGEQPPYRSMLTRVTAVPYTNALRPGAAYKGEEVLRDLITVLREVRPTKVFLSHPADDMPDHRALYLFARVALWQVEPEVRPVLYPYLVHFKRWPKPPGYQPTLLLEPPRTLREHIAWQVHPLTAKEVEQKLAAVRAHRTQYAYSRPYLLSFVKANELFGDFPPIALHAGTAPITLAPNDAEALPEQLTEEERAKFVGVEMRHVFLDHGKLVLSIRFSRPLAKAVGASLYVFGYRADRPFEGMPKLHIRLTPLTQEVFDQARRLPEASLRITRQARQVTVEVPLNLLGDPERILTSARTYLGDVPLDWVSWRILDLS